MLSMRMDKPGDEVSGHIKDRVLNRLKKERNDGNTYDRLAEQTGYSKTYIYHLVKGDRGAKLTLNAALRIWEGLGENPKDLIQGLGDSLMFRLCAITDPLDRQLIAKLLDILDNSKFDKDQAGFKILKEAIEILHKNLFPSKTDQDN